MEKPHLEKENLENKNQIKEQNYYNQQVKLFMNVNLKDEKYISRIKKNPESLYLSIDKNILSNWETLLINKKEKSNIPTDIEINKVEKNLEFQTVIKNDCNRSRVTESVLINNFLEILQNLITYYCKSKNIFYKQGLNEIFAPLLLMKYKLKELSLSKIYFLCESFIDKFLPNYFYEKEFYSLHSSLGLLLILIRYHEPSVYNRLDSFEIIPEMYATNWIMTYGMGRLKLDILYNLWNHIVTINDPLFLHFYFVAMIINKRELIINCDKNLLPTLMANLTILSFEDLNLVINKAKELRNYTPFSFRILANKLGILIPKNKNLINNFEKYKPLSLPAMPIFPSEILYITNKSEIECPDEGCKTLEKYLKDKNFGFEIIKSENSEVEDYSCEKCDWKIEKKMNFFMLDLRILEYGLNKEENESDKTGYLPLMINVEQEELKSDDIADIIAKRYINERGKFHFIFLTTSTDAFLNFEEKFYKANISEEDEKKIMFGLMEKSIEKELNFDSKKLTKKQIFKLKEYDNFRKILKSLKKQNYPYIAFVYGGFEEIHKKCKEYGIELLLHNEETCILCKEYKTIKEKNKNKKIIKEKTNEKNELYNKLWEHKKRIKYQNLNEVFKESEKTFILFGILIKYKGKHLELEKKQILIVIKTVEYKIEIYKFSKNAIDIMAKEGYYGLGIDDDKKDNELILIEEIKVIDVLGLQIDKKIKNIINFNIRSNEYNNKSQENQKISTFDIVIDFSSSKDSKKFLRIFKEMSIEYKNQFKK
jgi:DNA-dependent RNA polymerase auxiliary subunit epsilon